jgi:hypothetical protein
MKIKGTYLQQLFEVIEDIYVLNGLRVFDSRSWEREGDELNKWHSCELIGNFIKTDEKNTFHGFISNWGDHYVFGSFSSIAGEGRGEEAFAELTDTLNLTLAFDEDKSGPTTYNGYRVRYWKINNPEFSEADCPPPKEILKEKDLGSDYEPRHLGTPIRLVTSATARAKAGANPFSLARIL